MVVDWCDAYATFVCGDGDPVRLIFRDVGDSSVSSFVEAGLSGAGGCRLRLAEGLLAYVLGAGVDI